MKFGRGVTLSLATSLRFGFDWLRSDELLEPSEQEMLEDILDQAKSKKSSKIEQKLMNKLDQ